VDALADGLGVELALALEPELWLGVTTVCLPHAEATRASARTVADIHRRTI
jgi:hypothetical protein